jgi:hypothetical protein
VNTAPAIKVTAVKRRQIDYKGYVKRSAEESDYITLIKEDCVVVDEDTKEIVFIYATLPFNWQPMVKALEAIQFPVNTRVNGLKTQSRIFGFMPRVTTRADYCRTASLAQENPVAHTVVCKYGISIANMYSQFAPEIYTKHEQLMQERVLNDYAIRDTPFTSGIINKNNPLKYHFDSGNFKGVYSAMAVFKRDIMGGHLAIPEYNLGVELANNTLFMFDGQSVLHGVTPIRRLTDSSMRYSVVYYAMQQMWQCLPLGEEVARIRDLKHQRELKRWEKLKSAEVSEAIQEELENSH